MPEPTEPATTVPALPTSAIPLVPDARHTGGRRPLPDAQAICSCTVPEIAPPYDDAAPVRRQARGTGRGGLTSVTARRGSARGDRGAEEPVPQRPSSHAPGQPPPQAGPWPSQFAQVLAETLAGSRPADQIVPWTTEQARRRISQLGPMLATVHRPRVRRVIVSSPASGVLEMTVIVGLGTQLRAVAVRLERADGPASSRQAGEPVRPRPGRYRRPDDRAYDRRTPGSGEWLCTAIEAA